MRLLPRGRRRRSLDQVTTEVKPLLTGPRPPIAVALHPRDKLALTITLEVLALELLRDRAGAIADVTARAATYAARHMSMVTVNEDRE